MIFRELISGGGAFGAGDYFSGCGEVLTKILMTLITSRKSKPQRAQTLVKLGMRKHIILYGILGGVLIAGLKFIEYRWLVVEHSIEIYGALVAAVFAAFGIWLGLRLTRHTKIVEVREVMVEAPSEFVCDQEKLHSLGITPRELEVLQLIAEGLSNKEIAARVFVSENTIKTHSSRVFDKLGARRRTQAVQIAKEFRLIP
jgi:DNA-binding CsgD family transcriptional regulator